MAADEDAVDKPFPKGKTDAEVRMFILDVLDEHGELTTCKKIRVYLEKQLYSKEESGFLLPYRQRIAQMAGALQEKRNAKQEVNHMDAACKGVDAQNSCASSSGSAPPAPIAVPGTIECERSSDAAPGRALYTARVDWHASMYKGAAMTAAVPTVGTLHFTVPTDGTPFALKLLLPTAVTAPRLTLGSLRIVSGPSQPAAAPRQSHHVREKPTRPRAGPLVVHLRNMNSVTFDEFSVEIQKHHRSDLLTGLLKELRNKHLELREFCKRVRMTIGRDVLLKTVKGLQRPGDMLYLPRGHVHAARACVDGSSLHHAEHNESESEREFEDVTDTEDANIDDEIVHVEANREEHERVGKRKRES